MGIRVLKILLGLAIFSIPFQIKILTYQNIWGQGLFNPYLSIFISQTDILIFLTAIFFLFYKSKKKEKIYFGDKKINLFLLVLLLIVLFSFFNINQPDFLFINLILGKFFILYLFYILLVNKILKFNEIVKIFVYAMIIESIFPILQFIRQDDFGFKIIGEININPQNPLIAKFDALGQTFIRTYGTFPHPNILGGFLVVAFFLSLLADHASKKVRNICVILISLALLTTFSRSALLSLIFSLIFLSLYKSDFYKEFLKINNIYKFIISLMVIGFFTYLWFFRFLNLLKDNSLIERIEGFKISLNVILNNIFGIGFGHYTLYINEFSNKELMPWQLEPTHNVFLLFLSEGGIIPFIIFLYFAIYIFYRTHKKTMQFLNIEKLFTGRILLSILISILIISNIDHYFVSLDQGRFLLVLIFSLTVMFLQSQIKISPIKKI